MSSRLPRLTAVLALVAAAAVVAPQLRNSSADEPATARAIEVRSIDRQKPAAPLSPESTAAGDKLLAQVTTALKRRASVSARLRHQIRVGDRPLYGTGSYWQQGSGPDLRVRMELQIAGQEASLLQICDSRFLWIDRQLPTGRTVSRLDLRQLRADPELSIASPEEIEPGKASWTSAPTDLVGHSGGLPSLFASLAENFSFLPPQAMRLAAPAAPDAPSASVPVFTVVGHWKPEKLIALVRRESDSEAISPAPESQNDLLSLLNSLPSRLPQEVLVLVGQSDLFPYRIEYRRLETPLAASQGATPIPYQLSANPLVVLELTDVAFDIPVAAGQFDYAPGDADWVDQTATVLERLRRERQAQIAVRPSDEQGALPVR